MVEQEQIAVVVQVWDDGAIADVTIQVGSAARTTCSTIGQERFACRDVALVLGDNVLTVRARDAAANEGEMSFAVRRVAPADDLPPTIAFLEIADGDTVTTSAITVRASVTDAGGLSSVSFETDHDAAGACALESGDVWGCGPIPLPVGNTTIAVTAVDAAGNSASASITITRQDVEPLPDVAPPTVAIVEPSDGATVMAGVISVRVAASDDRGVISVTFVTDHGARGVCPAQLGGDYVCTSVPLPLGATTITVTAADAAGNRASDSVTVERIEVPDEAPPSVAIVEPVDGATVTENEITVSIEASDDRGVASVSFVTNHGASGACTASLGDRFVCGPVPLPVGITQITVTALDEAGNSASAAVTVQRASPPTPAFDIEIVFFDEDFTASQRAAFAAAAARWEEIVVGDLADVDVELPANGCFGYGEPTYTGTIDDLLIFATSFTEGVGGLLGSAGPCLVRASGADVATNLVGLMRFDTEDLASLEENGVLVDVILHEMGHVLGLGANWEFPPYFDLLDYLPAGPALSCRSASGFLKNPTYTGAGGVAGWRALGGSGVVPVEETGGPGTQCGHWDEQTFGSELMTGYLNVGGSNPVSAMTVRSLEDIGLTVDPSAADPYALPALAAPRAPDELNLLVAEDLLRPRGSVDPATGRIDAEPTDRR